MISVVIPTRHRATLLRGCIESLLAQDFPPGQYEVIVADDGSTDNTPNVVNELASRRPSPEVRHLSLSRVGVNGARNAGIKSASGDIVCIVDDDELVQAKHLKIVAEHFQARAHLDGVGGPYRPFGPSRIRTCNRCVPGSADLPGSGKRSVRRLFGGNMALRKAVFERRGFFDDELSGFGDEYEWFLRDPPLELLYDPELWLWHRRDEQTLLELCKSAWSQGLSIPLWRMKSGIKESSSRWQCLRYVGHGVLRRCGMGFVLACREAGALSAVRALRRSGHIARLSS